MEVEETSSDTVVPGRPVTVRLDMLKYSLKKNLVVSEDMMNYVEEAAVFVATLSVTTSEIAST